jgi:uncharacterized membrane protein
MGDSPGLVACPQARWIGSTAGRGIRDDSRAVADALLLSASVASLVAVGLVLAGAAVEADDRGALTAFAVISVLMAWSVVHTIYALRYARLCYSPPVGGLGFGEDDPPDYADFAYIAFTIVMTR